MFLWIVLSCLYFIPGALLLHGSLWFVTRGKHDFYDVLKIVCLLCVLFVLAARSRVLEFCVWLGWIVVGGVSKFVRISIKEWAIIATAVIIFVLWFVVQAVFCAWFVRLDGGKRLGLLRAAAASALQEFVGLGIFVICWWLFGFLFFFVASLGR